ncbi:MAG: phosphatidate cytidylyltransferase [Methylococcaceae bacterium]|jgi:phosphatidate cytidylyltransferase|nr:phosphatidate cytidylyltransferase [Methylococcaceae bacterium]
MNWLAVKPNVAIALAGVFGALLLSSAIRWLLQHRHPEKPYTELHERIRSWWIMVSVFAVAISLNRQVSLAFFALVSFLALKEYFSLIPTRRADRRVLFWAYLAIPLQYLWIAREWYGMFIIFIPVYAFLFLPMRMIMIGETQHFLRAIGTLHWGLMTMAFSISHVAFLLVMPETRDSVAGGAGLVLFVVLLTELNDIAQYVWGKLFGRHAIVPSVSPMKTWEGFVGGFLSTAGLAVLLAPWLTPLSQSHALLAGLLIGWAGFIGDVVISAIKRDIGVKDSGSLIPGHGGILDRIDSLTYTAPLFFHFVRYHYF